MSCEIFMPRRMAHNSIRASTERARMEHALAVLCGQPPGTFSVAANPSSIIPPELPAGLPSALLQRRPDIVEAVQSR